MSEPQPQESGSGTPPTSTAIASGFSDDDIKQLAETIASLSPSQAELLQRYVEEKK